MNDRLKEIGQKLLKRLDLTVLAILGFLLLSTGYLFLVEQNFTPPEPPTPAPKQFDVKLPIEGVEPDRIDEGTATAFERLQQEFVLTNPNIRENPEAIVLIERPMFSRRSAEDMEAMNDRLNAQYQQAEELYRGGRIDQARSLLQDILRQNRGHREAGDLLERIEAETADAEATDG